MDLLLVALGLGAGALTTITGQGGGLLLLLAARALVGPHAALAITAPALLLGNAHRAFVHRRAIAMPIASRMIAGAVPGAVLGGALARRLPPFCLDLVLVGLTGVALAKAAGLVRFSLPKHSFAPAGFGVGAMTGAAGGAGILFSPILLSVPLRGAAFVGTSSAIAVATHAGRVVGYGLTGLLGGDRIWATILLAGAIFVGNALGERVRRHVSDQAAVVLEYGTLVVCVIVSVVGL